MVTKKQQYRPQSEYLFLDEKRRQLALIRKRIKQYGIDPNELVSLPGIDTKLHMKKRPLKTRALANVSQDFR